MPEKKYRGVIWNRELQKWCSTVRQGGKTYNCGMHEEQKDAVKARDTAILKHGLNSPLQILKPLNKKDDKIERT